MAWGFSPGPCGCCCRACLNGNPAHLSLTTGGLIGGPSGCCSAWNKTQVLTFDFGCTISDPTNDSTNLLKGINAVFHEAVADGVKIFDETELANVVGYLQFGGVFSLTCTGQQFPVSNQVYVVWYPDAQKRAVYVFTGAGVSGFPQTYPVFRVIEPSDSPYNCDDFVNLDVPLFYLPAHPSLTLCNLTAATATLNS